MCNRCSGVVSSRITSDIDPLKCLETVNSFCYLGDQISHGGGSSKSIVARVRKGWKMFRENAEDLRRLVRNEMSML